MRTDQTKPVTFREELIATLAYIQLSPGTGKALLRLRQSRGVSRTGLAQQAGVSSRTIQEIEDGREQCQESTLMRICNVLSIDIHALTHESRAVTDALVSGTEATSFDVFFSSPMSSVGTNYPRERADALRIVEWLRHERRLRVYSAVETRPSEKDFEDEAIALGENLDVLRRSQRVVALFPARLVSSVLVEIGVALGIGIPTTVFVRDKGDLPSLLRGNAERVRLRIVRYRRIDDILTVLRHEEIG